MLVKVQANRTLSESRSENGTALWETNLALGNKNF